MVWFGLAAGMALRRGDPQSVEPLIEELQALALASGEAQRIVPMACVVLPWLAVSGRADELRLLAEEVLTTLDGQWPSVLSAVPVLRALAAAGEAELLRRTIESMEQRSAAIICRVNSGAMFEVHVTLGAARDMNLQPGREVWLVLKTYSCHVVV